MVDYNTFDKQFGSTGNKFLKFSEMNPIEGEFIALEMIDNPFKKLKTDPDKALKYTFLINGEEKVLTSLSVRLYAAIKKAKVEEGDTVRIERHGLGRDTDYEVQKV